MDYFISRDPLTNNVLSVVLKVNGLFHFIPIDVNNIDYQKYLEWCDDGNVASSWSAYEHNLPVVTPNGVE